MKGLRSVPRTIVVAGGGGFLGSHLCQLLLEEGHTVVCIDSFLTGTRENMVRLESHPRFHLIEQDICEKLDPGITGIDAVYNLACAASPPRYQADPVHTMMTSVLGTKNLLDLAERHDARFLQASTSEVYGDPEQHPQTESYRGYVNCTGPRACYDEGKRAAEALCFDYLRLERVDVRVARIFNTYGPRMRPDDGRIISNFIWQALHRQPLTIYGSGRQTRSFCYVSDLVEGLARLAAIDAAPDGPVNLGNPTEFSISRLAKEIVKHIPGRLKTVHMPLPEDDPQRRRPDIAQARALLGWEPRVPLHDGIGRTIEWFTTAGSAAATKAMRKNDGYKRAEALQGRSSATHRGIGTLVP
jgi:UDP-glucuronate decarboxylase